MHPGMERRHELRHLKTTLEAVHHGLIMIAGNGGIEVCNARASELLGLPQAGLSLDLIRARLPGVDFSMDEHKSATVLNPVPGLYIEVHLQRLPDKELLLVIEDISIAHAREAALRQAESEYRSLFENSVYGIYRDTLDGVPVRGNPAIVALNGYASEAEYIAKVSAGIKSWYVDPNRSEDFQSLMRRDGRVEDFVSEVISHSTGERRWISENAWYVCDAEGRPIYIEGTIMDATERATGLATIVRQANTDALTGAASRFHFLNSLNAQAHSEASCGALFSVDLDRFKEVNDVLGHGAGDIVLKAVAERLQSIAGQRGLVGRLGGDEFAVLMTGEAGADVTALKIVDSLRQPILIDGRNVVVGGSVGVAFHPTHADSAADLLTNADLALYKAKTNGRNGFQIFGPELRSNLLLRRSLEDELREAAAAGEMELNYQPIIESKSGDLAGYEALMRWNHPQLGLLPPARFIPVAEDAGIMQDLGNWAVAEACRRAATLPPHLTMAVNVSPSQFRSESILTGVRHALEESGLDPCRLILEVTETVILSSEAIAQRVIGNIQDLGVQLALDDFGTGYSSLSYLQRFAFSKVKIDQTFVAGIETAKANRAIIRAIIGLCRDLGVDVVAEGVETEAQADILRAEGCEFMQGYLWGRPAPFAIDRT